MPGTTTVHPPLPETPRERPVWLTALDGLCLAVF